MQLYCLCLCPGDCLTILDSLKASGVDEKSFDTAVNQAKEWADKELEDAIKKVDLSGVEVLDLLNKGMSPKIQEIFDKILKDTVKKIKDDTGVSFDPFIQKYPLEIDEQSWKGSKNRNSIKNLVRAFEVNVNKAS